MLPRLSSIKSIRYASPAFLIENFLHWQKIADVNQKELTLTIVWDTSVIKVPGINLGYDSKIGGNSTFVLKFVSGSFCIQKCNLRPTSVPVAYFEL